LPSGRRSITLYNSSAKASEETMTIRENIGPGYESRESFRVGAVLGTSWSVYSRNIAKFLLLGLIAELPMLVANFVTPIPPTRLFTTPEGWAVTLIGALLGAFISAASSYGVYEDLRGQNFSVGSALRIALSCLVPIVAASVLMLVAIEIGFALLIVPGLMIACRYYVAIAACVSERLGPLESMKRSAELTAGRRWPILGLMVIVYGVAAVPSYFFQQQLYMVGPQYNLFLIAGMLYHIVVSGVQAVVAAVAYFRLRQEKEGVDISQLTTVFD
jgi:hypothetical protein